MTAITIGAIRYNAINQAYEARVDVTRHGTTFRYPCQMTGPADLEPSIVASELTHQAMRMSDSPRS
jgi:hypothetical protein